MREDLQKRNLIVQLSFDFAVRIVAFCAYLDELKKWSLASQLLRSALSIGANVREAQNAESKPDFIHKIKIAAKEAEEAAFYLEACIASPELPDPGMLLGDIQAICRVLNKIISTSKSSRA
jgi:four helix bundle protein